MKNISFFLVAFLALSISSIAQTDWRTTGNDSDPGRFLGTTDNMPLIFKTYNIERMRLTETGLFGIGTTNPTALLDVNGNVKFNGLLNFANWVNTGETQKRFLYVNSSGTTSWLKTTALTDAMYSHQECVPKGEDGTGFPAPVWNNSGGVNFGILFTGEFCPARVGIGTDAPVATLDVQGDQFILDKLSIGNSNNGDHKLHIRTENQDGLYVLCDNDDGLTHTPLRISSLGTSSTDVLTVSDAGEMKIVYIGPISNEMFTIKDAADNDLFRVTSDGHAYSTGVIVKEAPFFPDYVFDEGYKRMSLYELEQFIKTNKRLPNMPTAEEVKTEGADLYELVRVLTEKVEELTLYAIEQQKEIDELKEQKEVNEKTNIEEDEK